MARILPLLLVGLLAIPTVLAQGNASIGVNVGSRQAVVAPGVPQDVAYSFQLTAQPAGGEQSVGVDFKYSTGAADYTPDADLYMGTTTDSMTSKGLLQAGHPISVTLNNQDNPSQTYQVQVIAHVTGADGDTKTSRVQIIAYRPDHAQASQPAILYPFKFCFTNAAECPTPTTTTTSSSSTTTTTSSSGDLPGPLQNLRIGSTTETVIGIVWDAVTGATGYVVERGTSASSLSTLSTVSGTEYQDTGLSSATQYFYRVHAVNAAGAGTAATISGTTLAAPDTQPPSGVPNLHLGQVTATTVSLLWDAATDNVGVDHYTVHRQTQAAFTPGAGTAVGTSAGLAFTDAGLSPSTDYYYFVVASDARGNAGQIGAQLHAVTTPPPKDTIAPTIRDLVVDLNATGQSFRWATDEPAGAVLHLTGGARDITRSAGQGTSFRVGLDLLPGVYDYTITATDPAGNAGTRAGQFRVFVPRADVGVGAVPHASITPMDPVLAAQVAALLPPVRADSIVLVDTDGNGKPDLIEDAAGQLSTVHAAVEQGTFLMRSAAGAMAVVVPAQRTAEGAHSQAVTSVDDGLAQSGLRAIVVHVADKAGWIVVSVADKHPDEPILGLSASDGRSIPLGFIWRENGQIRFFDDAAFAYTVTVAPAQANPAGASDSAARGFPLVLLGGLAVLVLLLVGVVLLVTRRKL